MGYDRGDSFPFNFEPNGIPSPFKKFLAHNQDKLILGSLKIFGTEGSYQQLPNETNEILFHSRMEWNFIRISIPGNKISFCNS